MRFRFEVQSIMCSKRMLLVVRAQPSFLLCFALPPSSDSRWPFVKGDSRPHLWLRSDQYGKDIQSALLPSRPTVPASNAIPLPNSGVQTRQAFLSLCAGPSLVGLSREEGAKCQRRHLNGECNGSDRRSCQISERHWLQNCNELLFRGVSASCAFTPSSYSRGYLELWQCTYTPCSNSFPLIYFNTILHRSSWLMFAVGELLLTFALTKNHCRIWHLTQVVPW